MADIPQLPNSDQVRQIISKLQPDDPNIVFVFYASPYDVDGNSGCTIYHLSKGSSITDTYAGVPTPKTSAPFQVFSKLRNHLPCFCRVERGFKMSQGKEQIVFTDVSPIL